METKGGHWFNEITLPNRSTLADSVGYLDRLIGGETSNQRQFMFPPAAKRNSLNNHKSIASNSSQSRQKDQPKHDNKIKRSPTGPIDDLDDIKWLEERRKKFPKIGQQAPSVETVAPVVPNAELEDEPKEQPASHHKHRLDSNTRKKTLFEKLMDSS